MVPSSDILLPVTVPSFVVDAKPCVPSVVFKKKINSTREFLTVAADNDTAHCKPLPLRVLKVLLVGVTFQTALIIMLKTNIWCSDVPQDM